MEDKLYINDIGEEVAVNPEEANTESTVDWTKEIADTEQELKGINSYQRAQERKANREERKAKFNQFGENFAKWWEAYNGVSTPAVADVKKPAEATTVATQDFGNVGEGATINQTNGGGSTSGASVGGGVATTTDSGTTDATSLSFLEQKIANNAASKATKAQLLRDYNKSRENGLGAYEALMRSALANKQAIAERKERDARSKAFTNALGTLVGAFTSHSMAKKGGYVPIVNAHDVEPDNAFRKSVEERYALENENENLLLQLAQERRKYEDDLAKSLYEKGVADVDAETKIKNDAIDAKEQQATSVANRKAIIDYEIDSGYRSNPTQYAEQKAEQEAQKKQAKKLEEEANAVAQRIFDGKQKDTVTKKNGQRRTSTSAASFANYNHSLKDFYIKAVTNRGLTKGIEDEWVTVWNNLFVDEDYARLLGNTKVDREIIDMLKNKNMNADKVIAEIKNNYPKAEN